MAGGQGITSGQGSVTPSESKALSGSAVTSSPGTLSADLGPTLQALTGEGSTASAGTAVGSRILSLRSRKVGGGSASRAIVGIPLSFSSGSVVGGPGQFISTQLLSATNGSLSKNMTHSLTGSVVTASTGNTSVLGSGSSITTLGLTATTGGANMPFTFGQPFKRGDIPSGQFITSNLASFQADVRNRWPDGSIKFAVLSGLATLTSGVTLSASLQTTGSAPSGSNITEASLVAANPSVTVALSGFGTVTLSSLLGSTVRTFPGPVMSEFHYRSAVGSDAHLVVWFFVRLYINGQIEIEIVVENGYMKVASPGDRSYIATITINGTVRYSAALTHWPRTRWGTINWYDGTSGLTDFARVTPSHNAAYFVSTKLVPNYSLTAAPTAAYLNTLPQNLVPLGNGSHQAGSMANAGAADHIGILPRWEVAYVMSGDVRAYRATLVNGYASNSWPVAFRDEVTQRPLAPATRPNIDSAGWGIDPVVDPISNSNANSFGSGTQAHMPSCGYTSYLLTGRWSQVETAMFWCARSHMEANPTGRGLTTNNGGTATAMTSEDRGKGWHIRTAHQAAAIYPDTCPTAADQTVRDQWISAIGGTYSKWSSNALSSPLGYISNMYNPGLYDGYINLPDLGVGAFQMYFIAQSVGYSYDLDILSGSSKTLHQTVRDHFYKFPIGQLGDSSGWSYRQGPNFASAVGTWNGTTVTWDTTWAQAYARHRANTGGAAGTGGIFDFSPGLSIVSGNFPSAGSYGGNMLPAISYAVEHGVPGASAAYGRLQGASNYAAFVADQANAPQWAVAPRSDPAAAPSHISSAAEGQWTSIGTNTLSSVAFDYTGWSVPGFATNLQAIMNAWSGGAYDPGTHRLFVNGGGHNDYDGNETYAFNLQTNAWARLDNPSPHDEDAFSGGAQNPNNWNGVFPDNGPQPIHTYDVLSVNPNTGKLYRLGLSGSACLKRIQEFDPSLATQQTLGTNRPSWSYKATVNWSDGHSGTSAWMSDEAQFIIANQDGGTFINFRRYNPTTDTVGATIAAIPGGFYSGDMSMSYSPSRRIAVVHRTNASSNTLLLLNTATNTVSIQTVTGATLPARCGLEYDSRRDVFMAYTDEGADRRVLYSINPNTWVATLISPTGTTPLSAPAGDYRGIYGRFAYCPDYDVFLAVNSATGNAFIYKPIGWSAP